MSNIITLLILFDKLIKYMKYNRKPHEKVTLTVKDNAQ